MDASVCSAVASPPVDWFSRARNKRDRISMSSGVAFFKTSTSDPENGSTVASGIA